MCGHILNEREVGITAAARAAEWAGSAEPAVVAEFLIGGITKADVARDAGLVWESADPTSMLLPPLPNFLFQRDPSCWIYDGVTINPMTKPARKPETMIMEAIYRFAPMFAAEEFPVWLGGSGEDWGRAHVEGGDVQPIRNWRGDDRRDGGADHALPGRCCGSPGRCSGPGRPRWCWQVHLPPSRGPYIAPGHGDHTHTHSATGTWSRCSPRVVYRARTWAIRPRRLARMTWWSKSRPETLPELMGRALGVPLMRVIEDRRGFLRGRAGRPVGRAATTWSAARTRAWSWRMSRNTGTNTALRKAGIEVITVAGFRAGQGPRRRPLHDRPARSTATQPSDAHRRGIVMAVQPEGEPVLPQGDRLHPGRARLPAAPVGGAEAGQVRRHRGPAPAGQGDRADLREDLDPDPVRVRGRRPYRPGRARDLPRTPRAPARATRSRSPIPPRCWAGCTTRSSSAALARPASRSSPRTPGVPVAATG